MDPISIMSGISAAVTGIGSFLSSNKGTISTGAKLLTGGLTAYDSYRGVQSAQQAMSFIPQQLALETAGINQDAEATAQADEYNANIADYNAGIALQNAGIARDQGQALMESQQRDAARTLGTLKANAGAAGITSDSGSPVEALMDSARMATLDKLTILYNADLAARSFEAQSTSNTMQAGLYRQSAKNARTSGAIRAQAAAQKSQADMVAAMSSIRNSKSSALGALTNLIPRFG